MIRVLLILACATWLLPGRTAGIVDEPLGARYSLGMTLWHLGHQAERISQFHAYLAAQGIRPESLLPTGAKPPKTVTRLLIEPELLAEEQMGDGANRWKPEGDYLTSWAGDSGPTATMPLHIATAGTYRLWVRYYGYTEGTGVTFLKIARAGATDAGLLVDDEFYDQAVKTGGPTWKDIIVDFAAGDYTVRLGHVTRWWHALTPPNGYLPRKIDCLYLTDAIWADAPSDALRKELREATQPSGVQWTASVPLAATEHAAWRRWQARPLSWEDAAKNPKLFDAGRAFWKRLVNELAMRDYPPDAVPDYRAPERQVVFNDIWNMVGNPVRIRKQILALAGDIRQQPTPHRYYWLPANTFTAMSPEWTKSDYGLVAGYGEMTGTAQTTYTIEQPGRYYCWVRRYLLNGYFAPWSLKVTAPTGTSVTFNNDQQEYPSDWSRIGDLEVTAPGDLQLLLSPLRYRAPATYRRVCDVFFTTDPTYQPKGTVRPPITSAQYLDKAMKLGANRQYRYLLWTSTDIHHALLQETWPTSSTPQVNNQVIPLTMAADSSRSAQLCLRSTEAFPVTLTVSCGPLRGKNGTFSNKVTWRVIGFVPYGAEFRQNWSPFCLLRRPSITVPPYNVAGIWLTVDSHGLPAGDYASTVTLHRKGDAPRTVALKVTVSQVKINPRQPTLAGGWTGMPDVTNAERDFTAHGLNIWTQEISKTEMQRRGFRLLALPQWSPNEQEIRDRIERLKKLGLEYNDYIFTIIDEPSGKTEVELKSFLDVAKAIRAIDPKVRISFNPGEAAGVETFKILDPYCDFWIPYSLHVYYVPQLVKQKQAFYAKKPWMWYTTPCYYDKSPGMAGAIFDQIRAVPGQPGNCLGTEFFAFYYPFRDPWDSGYEHIGDVSVMVLPSRHGSVATPAFEAIREGLQAADLARMVKERAGDRAGDPRETRLIAEGTVDELLAWLEAHPQ